MTKSKAQRPTRPPASGKKLEDAIEQSLKTLDSLATPRLRTNEKWRQGPLVWKVMLEMSREGLVKGRAPSIRKHDLAYELKRSYGSGIEVDHNLWKRYLSFHQQFRSRLREGTSRAGLPALALERVTNGGLGGDPDKTEAVYWLCFDSDSQTEAAKSSLVPGATHTPEAALANEDSACAARSGTATSEPATPQPSEIPKVDGSEPQAAPTDAANEHKGPAMTDKNATDQLQTAAGQSYLAWLATLLCVRTERSSATPAALILALALLAPALGSAAAEITSPVQALADSISSLFDVFNGLIDVRT
jgi:hypothetical protein